MTTRIPALILAAGAAFATGAFAQAQPPAKGAYVQPRIVVLLPKLAQDQLIKDEVIQRIAGDARLSGRVGVEIDKGTVTLTGRVTDPNQVDWAEEDALSVDGVRDVTNLVNAGVGAF